MIALRPVRHSAMICTLGVVALALLALGGPSRPILIYNASASAPVGLYRVLPARPVRLGDLVLASTPGTVRSLAAERGYLPGSVPMVKRVAALSGDTVCAMSGAVTIDGRRVADQLLADRRGRPLPVWSGCRILDDDEAFLLMEDAPDSFDGRYFGPVRTSAIIGTLEPLWIW
jgi:conjugative transfer signal peptidase TraF